jgi:hypothetical protein
MYIIPIGPATDEIVKALNGGVAPVVEGEEKFFVYNEKDKTHDIVAYDELDEIAPEWMTKITILYRG